MKILHTSDIHLFSPLNTTLEPSKVQTRRRELLSTFDRMIERAICEGVELFIIAGDLFDSEVSPDAYERTFASIERARSIQFIYLVGNHEGDTEQLRSARIPGNLKIIGDDWTYFDYNYLHIAGKAKNSPDMFNSIQLSETGVNLVILHGEVGSGTGRDAIPQRALANLKIDYLALGHYHSYSVAKMPYGVAVYPGTPEGRGFDEAFPCGFVLIDTDGKSLRHNFVQFAKRRIFDLRVDVSGLQRRADYEGAILGALTEAAPTDIVRITLNGERTIDAYADMEYLTSIFKERYFHFEIRDRSTIKIDIDAYKNDKTMVGEFIRLVGSAPDLSPREKNDIIMLGLKALRAGRGDL